MNNNRQIEAIEAEVAILSLYNVVNKRVPGWQDPPSRARIMESLKVFETDFARSFRGEADGNVRLIFRFLNEKFWRLIGQ